MELRTERASVRRRAVLVITLGGVGTAAVIGLGTDAGASRVETPTTIVLASGDAPPALDDASLRPVRESIASAWPDATVESSTEVVDDRVDYLTVVGRLGDATYQATIYRRFDVSELEGAGLPRIPTAAGDAWVGAADEAFTSVYFRSKAGVGVWVGVTPEVGAKPMTVDSVLDRAAALADEPTVAKVAEVVR